MLYCKKCKKEVVIFAASFSAGMDEALDEYREKINQEGKLILFNPPPLGKYYCPQCFSKLYEINQS